MTTIKQTKIIGIGCIGIGVLLTLTFFQLVITGLLQNAPIYFDGYLHIMYDLDYVPILGFVLIGLGIYCLIKSKSS